MSTIADRLSEIETRAAKATEGPWRTWGLVVMADPENTFDVSKAIEVAQTRYTNAEGKPRTNDADFIAAARTDVENLCAALRRAIYELDQTSQIEGEMDKSATRRVARHASKTLREVAAILER